jgi:hypothetical protein
MMLSCGGANVLIEKACILKNWLPFNIVMGYLFGLLLCICFSLQCHYTVLFGEASNSSFHSCVFLSVLPMS